MSFSRFLITKYRNIFLFFFWVFVWCVANVCLRKKSRVVFVSKTNFKLFTKNSTGLDVIMCVFMLCFVRCNVCFCVALTFVSLIFFFCVFFIYGMRFFFFLVFFHLFYLNLPISFFFYFLLVNFFFSVSLFWSLSFCFIFLFFFFWNLLFENFLFGGLYFTKYVLFWTNMVEQLTYYYYCFFFCFFVMFQFIVLRGSSQWFFFLLFEKHCFGIFCQWG